MQIIVEQNCLFCISRYIFSVNKFYGSHTRLHKRTRVHYHSLGKFRKKTFQLCLTFNCVQNFIYYVAYMEIYGSYAMPYKRIRIFFSLWIVVAEIWFSIRFTYSRLLTDITIHFTKRWSFIGAFWMHLKVFHNLWITDDFFLDINFIA